MGGKDWRKGVVRETQAEQQGEKDTQANREKDRRDVMQDACGSDVANVNK